MLRPGWQGSVGFEGVDLASVVIGIAVEGAVPWSMRVVVFSCNTCVPLVPSQP